MNWVTAGLIRLAASLSFGGVFGGGIAGLIHTLWLTNSTVPFYQFLITGILIGTTLHKPISWAWNSFLSPLTSIPATYIRLQKLRSWERLLSPEKYGELVARVIEEDVMNSSIVKPLMIAESGPKQIKGND